MMNENRYIPTLTRLAFLWTRILGTPFFVLINMLPFILYKDLHISPWQITSIIALKPMSSLLAPYWSQAIYQRPDHIIANLVWANIFRYLPFVFIPWIDSPWYIIFSFGLYMMLHRAVVPAWMELLKRNLPEKKRERTVGYWSTIDHLGTAIVTLALGFLLDSSEQIWRWLFPLMAVCGLSSTLLLLRLPAFPKPEPQVHIPNLSKIKEGLFKPWRQSWKLIREHSGFANYQIGFMLGGAGLMIMQPALPSFFVDTLHLSFVEMGLAISVCKGIGVALTSPFWIRVFSKWNIYYFSGLVTLVAALFPFLLLMAPLHLWVLYFAYGIYGIMQAGSELSWHMSGIVFAKEKESSAYSGTNVLTVGLRGCIIPAAGAIILSLTDSVGVMILGGILSLFSSWFLMRYSRLNFTLKQGV